MFIELKKKLQENFKKLSVNTLFYVTIDRDQIWEEYLNGFDDEIVKQGNNCNCCKSFLRQYGGIVFIIDSKKVSIWDNLKIDPLSEYYQAVENLSKYVHSLPITDVFYNGWAKCGTDKNLGTNSTIWNHFYVELPKNVVINKDLVDSKKGELRGNKEVLMNSLNIITKDALETVIELIAQNSLYRGKEFESSVKAFLELKKKYDKFGDDQFVWEQSLKVGPGLARIKNTAIGTLLVDLSEGTDLDETVTKFERVVAPTNYKRPTSLVTPRMVNEAKEKLTELGLIDSLERRHANLADINIENVLYSDKSSELTDVFTEMSKDSLVNPKTLTKVEEISIEDFIEKVIPTSKSIEVLLENKHLNNLVSILTAQDKNAPSLFKWNNPFSWSYTGGITDSMKERVKAAGGKVDGVLRFSLQWNEDGKSICDLDLHALEPDKNHIYYGTHKGVHQKTKMSGFLDVDMIRPAGVGVENITWDIKSKMKDGMYVMMVRNFDGRLNTGFTAEVEFDGQIHEFSYPKQIMNDVPVAEITLKNGVFSIKSVIDSKINITSKEQWSVKTNTFTKVKNIMLSPNHWENKTGNKHFIFTLDGCKSDESPRPFFNEFLKEEFTPNRKVFEILGGKVKIPETQVQLSGIGFSETQRNSLIVRVEGKFKRNLKINF